MPVDPFAVLAEPRRRLIVGALRSGEASVGELVERLALSQPTVSKHLKVLRDSGFVSSRTDAQRRIYSLEPAPLREVEEWLAPYRDLWARSFDALDDHLRARARDEEEDR